MESRDCILRKLEQSFQLYSVVCLRSNLRFHQDWKTLACGSSLILRADRSKAVDLQSNAIVPSVFKSR